MDRLNQSGVNVCEVLPDAHAQGIDIDQAVATLSQPQLANSYMATSQTTVIPLATTASPPSFTPAADSRYVARVYAQR
ncbi:hypothetical protein [Streptomyces sp. NPDC005953]|uniref:hypothetical protein n=1 Tax=Streptomyces sp. NPDC005953 TaxID=3156719 RepID=UPI0033FB549A